MVSASIHHSLHGSSDPHIRLMLMSSSSYYVLEPIFETVFFEQRQFHVFQKPIYRAGVRHCFIDRFGLPRKIYRPVPIHRSASHINKRIARVYRAYLLEWSVITILPQCPWSGALRPVSTVSPSHPLLQIMVQNTTGILDRM